MTLGVPGWMMDSKVLHEVFGDPKYKTFPKYISIFFYCFLIGRYKEDMKQMRPAEKKELSWDVFVYTTDTNKDGLPPLPPTVHIRVPPSCTADIIWNQNLPKSERFASGGRKNCCRRRTSTPAKPTYP